MPKDQQIISEIKITVQCECGHVFDFNVWDESLADNPYVDVICKCNKYYKKLGHIQRFNAKILKQEYTGKEL